MSKLATIYYAINWINSLFELILVWMLWINSLVFLYKLQLLYLVFIFPNLFLEIWTLFKENSRVDFVKIPISKTNFPNFLHHNNFDWCWCWCCSTTTQTSSKLNFKRQGETWKKKALDGIKIGIVFTKIEMLIQHSTEMKRSIRKNLMQTCQKKNRIPH